MKGIISWFAENHVAANLLMAFLLLAGAVTAFTMKIEVFPEASMDRISVSAVYPGASPAEVEEAVIRRIEENIAGLSGIKRIDSTARESFASVIVEVMKGWDIKNLLDEVKAEVDRITTFPKEMEKPVVRELINETEVINIAVYGDAPESTLKYYAEQIKDDLTNIKGITRADLFGSRTGEIYIEISEHILRKYGLTLEIVANAVRRGSLDLPAGSVKTKDGEILIRTKGREYYAKEYADIPVITRPDGTMITLKQIADLKEGFEDVDLISGFQGKPVVVVRVFRVADQNALDVAKKTKDYIEEIRPALPAGIEIDFYNDMTKILKSRLTLLLKNMGIGLLLVGLLLGFILNIRLAFWVTLGIPISFMTGFWLLPEFDISINMISLFAFILVLGIVVDDAIIIGENIFRKQEQGLAPLAAAKEGAVEVGIPVIFSVLTTMVAFYPLTMGASSMGKVMAVIPTVVILVLFGSLVESLFILPAHLSRSKHALHKSSSSTPEKQNGMGMWLKSFINGPYARAVSFCLSWRYVVFGVGIALLLIIFGIIKGGWIKFTFLPEVESDVMSCAITMPSGTPFEHTTEIARIVEKAARTSIDKAEKDRPKDALPLFEKSITLVGMQVGGHGPAAGGNDSAGHLAQVFIQLLEGEQRDMSAARLAAMWREEVGTLPDAESITFSSVLFTPGNPVEVHLAMDDHERLIEAAEKLKDELKSYPGVFDVADSFLPGKPEMQLKLKPAARSLGLTLSDLAIQVRHAFYGAEAMRLQRDKDEVKVKVRYPEAERKSLTNIEGMRIRTAAGIEVPFSQVAEVTMEQGYASIERAQRRRVIKVTADVDETTANANEVRNYLTSGFLQTLKQNYPGLRYAMEGEAKEQMETMGEVYRGFIIAIFAIYALLAIPFKSFTQPLVVMSAIPFGIIGAVGGHLLMGLNLSMLSVFGIVGLSGVVVNDSLVLIHAANRLRKEKNFSASDAVKKAGAMRFRAIILTSLTTFVGLAPMIVERSMQAKFLIPMAVSLGFGVLFATLITLLLVPCGYMVLEDMHSIAEKLREKSVTA